ncbi:hypothetical protein [Nocardia vaccinii]|uniref:hypothetical protein n=1 Tax=Nocardia vaccinii TaxID=1822 RepID=UPI00082EF02E
MVAVIDGGAVSDQDGVAVGVSGSPVGAPELVALVRVGALFRRGTLLERPRDITLAGPADTGTEVA